MRIVKIMGLVLSGLIALVAVALLAVWLFVDPNDYKDRIAQAVKSSTGRELAMPGDIKLSLFPWLKLAIGPASLGNPAGFGTEPFAVVQRAAVRVRLLPLLRKELQIGRIEIEGLDLRLQQNAAGKGNWEDFGAEPATDEGASGSTRPLDLAGVVITNSRISFDEWVAEKVGIDVGRVAPGRAIPVKLSLDLLPDTNAQPIHMAGAFNVMLEPDERYRLAAVDLGGTLTSKAGAIQIPWKLTAPEVTVDLDKQTLATPTFAAELAAAKVSGSLTGAQIIDAPDLRGEFELQPVALRELLGQLGITPPVTRDAKVLSMLAARGAYGYSNDALRAERLVVQLDDSLLEGSASTHLDTDAVGFDLSLDRVDFDRYLPPPSNLKAAGKKEPFELPADMLKSLLAKGKLTIGQAKIAGVALSALSVGVDANNGMTRLAPLKAQLYGGQYAGDIELDSRPNLPVLKMEQTMNGVDVAQLLTALAETKRLSGRGNLSMSLTAQGGNSDALIKSLRGSMSAKLVDGAVEGFDLWYAVNQAQSLLEKRTLAGGSDTRRTAFDTFKASANVIGGIATTDDLDITTRQLRVAGKGSTNFATQAIDYQVTATVLKGSGGTRAAIPVSITGTFDNPKLRPDLQGIAKERVKQEIDKRKDEIKEKLGEKLKGLFDR